MLDALNDFLKNGQIEKVKLKGFEDTTLTGEPKIFEAFINPDEITISYQTNIDHVSTVGQTGTPGAYLSSTPMEISLKFYLDGTKASGVLKSHTGSETTVADKIVEF